MTKTVFHRTVPCLKATLMAGVLAMTGCAGMMNTATAQNIAGLSPSGNVSITEDFVAGMGGGSGTLYFQGQTYPFKFDGTAAGPAAGLRKSARPVLSTSSPVVAILVADTSKAWARPVSALRAAAICGLRTVPA